MTNETSEKVIKDLGLEIQPQKKFKLSLKHFIFGVVVTTVILTGLSILFLFSLYLIGL